MKILTHSHYLSCLTNSEILYMQRTHAYSTYVIHNIAFTIHPILKEKPHHSFDYSFESDAQQKRRISDQKNK